MEGVQRHFVVCLITGLITILPIGGTILLIILAERSLSPLVPAKFYFPGEGLLLVIALLYLLGLALTSIVGRWIWDSLDAGLSRLPGLEMLYRTLKQILGFDAGDGALFQRVLLIRDDSTSSGGLPICGAPRGYFPIRTWSSRKTYEKAVSRWRRNRPDAPPCPASILVLSRIRLLSVLSSRNLAAHFAGSQYCT